MATASENFVSVIVPTFRRAHLLRSTIPSYIQEGVGEVIVVDDCSLDDTEAVVRDIAASSAVPVRYFRQDRNRKQTAAKNRGLDEARGEWVFFGDDDCVLLPGSIARLQMTQRERLADLVGARAFYMPNNATGPVEEYVRNHGRRARSLKDISDPEHLRFNFNWDWDEVIEIPALQTCHLIRRDLAREVRFDEAFTGNCYREETDFVIRCWARGARIFWDPRAVSVNLPPAQATGGARTQRLKYEWQSFRNHSYFVRKNERILGRLRGRETPWWILSLGFAMDRVRALGGKLLR